MQAKDFRFCYVSLEQGYRLCGCLRRRKPRRSDLLQKMACYSLCWITLASAPEGKTLCFFTVRCAPRRKRQEILFGLLYGADILSVS